MFKTKILILGPCGSGKTTMANYLADATETTGGDYRPTRGVRIVEFESNDLELNGQNIDAEVELWDCSGSKAFQRCWPAIQKDANGVILVANPDSESHARELDQWYQLFVARRGIKPSHVIVFAHQKPEEGEGTMARAAPTRLSLPSSMAHVDQVPTSIEADGENLRLEFNNFLCNVISGLTANAPPSGQPQPNRLLRTQSPQGLAEAAPSPRQGPPASDLSDEEVSPRASPPRSPPRSPAEEDEAEEEDFADHQPQVPPPNDQDDDDDKFF